MIKNVDQIQINIYKEIINYKTFILIMKLLKIYFKIKINKKKFQII